MIITSFVHVHSYFQTTHNENGAHTERKMYKKSEKDIGASHFVCARARLHLILLTTAIIITLTLNLYALNDYCSVVVPFMMLNFRIVFVEC